MATAEVQHPVPTAVAVHDGSCFQEEEKNENSKVPNQDGVPATTKVEEAAPGAEQVQVPVSNGVSEEETKGQEEDSNKENNPKDHHKDVARVATDGSECVVQAVAQEVEAKLGLGIIVQDDAVVDSAAVETDEAKLPKEAEAERRREVTRKAVAAKAAVVPVDDDDGLIDDDGEPAAPQEAASPEEENAEGEGEEPKEEKAHEE